MKAKANLFRTLLVLAVGVLLALAVALFGVGIRTAQPQTTTTASTTTTYYKVQDLGILPGNTHSPPTSVPYGINDSGYVAGYSDVGVGFTYYEGYYEFAIGHAFLYDGAMKDLGTLGGDSSSSATAINSSGQVVGYSVGDGWTTRAFLYKDGVLKELSTQGAIMSSSGIVPGPAAQANGINDSGQVVGLLQVYGTDNYSNNYHAFLWDSTNGMKDLGILGGTYTNYYSNSQANGINKYGQVVGWSAYDDTGHVHAFLYKDGKMTDLGDLSALGGTNSYAYGINTKGQVVGQAQYVDGGEWHAYLYDSASATPKMKDLGTLGGTNSSAYGINDSGQIVGFSQKSDGSGHAFLYDSASATPKMIDLGTRTHPDQNGKVWTLGNARGINKNGQIVADGSRIDSNGTTVNSALLLTPTSDPPPADTSPPADTPPPADTQAPSAPTITSPANNSYDNDGVVTISGTAEAGSTVTVVDDASSPTTKTATADSNTGAWSVTFGSSSSKLSDATYTYSATAKDTAANTSSASTRKVTVDKSAPSGTVSINNGDVRTRSQSVTLTLSATDPSPGSGVSQIRISNTQSGLTSASWETYSTSKPWTLTSGTGTKTVYVQYRDGAGNNSAIVSDTITYKP